MGEHTTLLIDNGIDAEVNSSKVGVKRRREGSISSECRNDRSLCEKNNLHSSRDETPDAKKKCDSAKLQEKKIDRSSNKNSINTLKSEDVLENCRNWVNHSRELLPSRTLRSNTNLKICYTEEEQVDSPDDVEANSDEGVSDNSSFRIRGKRFWLRDQKVKLSCEWRNCSYIQSDVDTFVRHVSFHIPDLDVRVNEDNREVFVCLWALCEFETEDPKEVVRHVNFHSYHTKLKGIGSMLTKRFKIPNCTFDPEGRNEIPDLLEEFACCWSDCDRMFNNTQMFLCHVQCHVQSSPRGRVVKGGVPCGWRGCKAVCATLYKLQDHVKTHTQEKVVACPTCGGMFCSKTKYLDHCKRQVPLHSQGYQCSHCLKYCSSERLLRDHMRHHVNHYKCRFCDMTCPTPSALGLHIRFRHLDTRPFKCQFCDFRAKTQQQIRAHTTTHYSENMYHCSAAGCSYSCRSNSALKKHFTKMHEGVTEALYCCHICDRRFDRGARLTRHLFDKHNFRWPSGHSRFRYKQDDDGFYRLQTVRYESLEVTQEMLRERATNDENNATISNKSYNLRRLPSRPDNPSVVFEVSEDQEDPQDKSDLGKKILITIDEVDDSGNVIKSQAMETEEVPLLPDVCILDE